MITKNEWSLITHSDKDINLKILAIDEISHTEEELGRLLALKESYEREGMIPKPEDLVKVLNCRVKKVKEDDGGTLCSCCFQQLSGSKYWCRICGNQTCKKCQVRERELKDQTRTFFCEKCDQQYLQAMSNITFFNKTEELRKGLERLVKQQESLEELVSMERNKLMRNGAGKGGRSELIEKTNKANKLAEQNRIMKLQSQELQKKVEFGKSINKQLRKKLHKLRKQQKESFGTISNTQEYNPDMEPPRLDNQLDISIDHIRQSILTTTEDPYHGQALNGFPRKCKCEIY